MVVLIATEDHHVMWFTGALMVHPSSGCEVALSAYEDTTTLALTHLRHCSVQQKKTHHLRANSLILWSPSMPTWPSSHHLDNTCTCTHSHLSNTVIPNYVCTSVCLWYHVSIHMCCSLSHLVFCIAVHHQLVMPDFIFTASITTYV